MHLIKTVLLSYRFYKLQLLPELMYGREDERLNLVFTLH